MRIDFQTKNYTVKEGLKDIITKKLERLDKYFDDEVKIKVMMKEAKKIETLELTVFLDKTVLRAELSGDPEITMYNLIDLVLPKLEKQIIKQHKIIASKSKKFRHKEIVENMKAEETAARSVVRKKVYELTPMTESEALEELELVGHSFFVYLSRETDKVSVLYKRNDGDYGIIEAVV